jgi:hypothetical protein
MLDYYFLKALPLCLVWLSADYTASTASILNLFTLSLDRYWSITSPLKYLGKRTRSRALLMIFIAWSLSLLWILPITSWSYLFNNGVRYVSKQECNTEYNKNIPFKVATAICNFYLPLIAMILINTKIYLVVRRRYHNPIMKYSSTANTFNNINVNSNNNNNNNNKQSLLESNSRASSTNNQNNNNNTNNNDKNEFYYHQVTETNFNRRKLIIRRSRSLSLGNQNQDNVKNLSNNQSFYQNSKLLKLNKQFKKSCENNNNTCNNNILNGDKINDLDDFSQIKKSQSKGIFLDLMFFFNKNTSYTDNNDTEKNRVDLLLTSQEAIDSSNNKKLKINKNPYNESIKTLNCSSTTSNSATPSYHQINVTNNTNNVLNSSLSSNQNNIISSSIRGYKAHKRGFMNKQEKAFKQLAAIIIGFTLCFSPYFIVFLIVAICEDCVSNMIFMFTVWLGYLNSTINPFLYALSNKRLNKSRSKKIQYNNNNNNNNRYNNEIILNNNNNFNYQNANSNAVYNTKSVKIRNANSSGPKICKKMSLAHI